MKNEGNKGWLWAVVKIGATVVAASAIGAWSTRRTPWGPMARGIVRGGAAGLAAYLLRKKAPRAATGLAVYALATAAEGTVEQYDMSRYLGMTDQERRALSAGSSSGAQTQGGTTTPAPVPAQVPGGAGYGYGAAAGYDPLDGFRRQGYVTL